jgi:hypothetical protein
VAVDFAKHGKCVSKESYEMIESKLRQWPDFMESGNPKKEVVESPYILGKLYRAVDCKVYYKRCIENDHLRSVTLDYKLNQYIIGDTRKVPEWHEHLRFAYEDIVLPMTIELKRQMITYKILNEGELFCTNLNFNLDSDRMEKLIGDPGAKDEDAVKQLNTKLKLLIEEFRHKFV